MRPQTRRNFLDFTMAPQSPMVPILGRGPVSYLVQMPISPSPSLRSRVKKAACRVASTHARASANLYAEGHDGVDNVVVVLLERLDGLLPRDAGLLHDQLNVLGLETGLVDLLAIVLLLFLLLLGGRLLALAVVVALVVTGSLGLSELLGSGGLGSGVQVLDLGLTEDAAELLSKLSNRGGSRNCLHPGVAVGGLVDVGVVDDEEDLRSNSQPELENGRISSGIAPASIAASGRGWRGCDEAGARLQRAQAGAVRNSRSWACGG